MMYLIRKVRWVGLALITALSLACGGAYHGSGGVGVPPAVDRCPEGQRGEWQNTSILFEDLREGILWQEPKLINVNGKVVVYQNLLFVLEPFEGVHVFDNSNNQNPIALGFLLVPGNSDIVVKDDVLYLDSYVDLVKIGVIDNQVMEIGRIHLAFGDAYRHDEEGIITGREYVCHE